MNGATAFQGEKAFFHFPLKRENRNVVGQQFPQTCITPLKICRQLCKFFLGWRVGCGCVRCLLSSTWQNGAPSSKPTPFEWLFHYRFSHFLSSWR